MTTAQATKAKAPEGVPQAALDAVLEATERKLTDDALMYVYEHLEAYEKMARGIARSGLTHHRTEAHVITIAIAAHEMHLPLTVALRGMFLVQGKLAMETWLMDLLATRLGVTKTVHEATTTACSITLHHPDRPDVEVAYTLEDAKRAGIIKDFDPKTGDVTPQPKRDNWKKHPEEMVYWRALSKGLRRIAPDLFGGVYTTDEADGIDERRAHETKATDTNAELDALTEGVDPDPELMTEDDIDQLRRELREAVAAGAIDQERREEVSGMAVDGRWSECREAWEGVRAAMIELSGPNGELPLGDETPEKRAPSAQGAGA